MPTAASGEQPADDQGVWETNGRMQLRRYVGLTVGLLVAYGILVVNAGGGWSYLLMLALVWMLLVAALASYISLTGRIFIAQAIFVGTGAYVYAILADDLGTGLAAVSAVSVSIVLGLAIGLLTRSMGSYQFAVTTIAVNVVFTNVLTELVGVTGGSAGISGIPPLDVAGFEIDASELTLTVLLVLLGAVLVAHEYLRLQPLGHLLIAASQNPSLVASWGVDVRPSLVLMMAINAAIAGFAGVIYASMTTIVVPDLFTLWASFSALIFVIVGGLRSVVGPVCATVLLIVLPDFVRAAGSLSLVIYGLLLLLVISLVPSGLSGGWSKALAVIRHRRFEKAKRR
jgi:branched-chain amino acid transport system permease protein